MRQNVSKGKLTTFVLLVAMIALTSCITSSSEELSGLQIYQPKWLKLKKGTTVQTPEGRYTTQTEETWVSLALYRQREAENIALATQVRKLTAELDLKK